MPVPGRDHRSSVQNRLVVVIKQRITKDSMDRSYQDVFQVEDSCFFIVYSVVFSPSDQ